MKFLKSKLAQKLIIILIALMIFNIAIPPEVKAWDFAGILLKPLTSLILSIMVQIDITIGMVLNGASPGFQMLGALASAVCADKGAALDGANSAIKQLFIGPDSIFCGEVRILNANIFNVITAKDLLQDKLDPNSSNSIVKELKGLASIASPGNDLVGTVRDAIANVYYTLRNICGYIMLAGLIFTGIQVLVSSNIPTKKTQYLMLLQDWFIGMILLIFSHIIMIGIFYVSDTLTAAISDATIGIGSLNLTLIKQCLLSFDSAEQIICLIMLGYMIYLTIIFAIAYFKRFMWICVLIVFAPVVSIMYAFGQKAKQTYSNWLQEYIMAVFVQPFHMIVYWALVAIPLDMVNSGGEWDFTGGSLLEIIYALGAMSFIRPAELYLRKLFGMDKGIANMASYDSGKQTFDEIKRTVTEVVKKVAIAGVAVAATVATAGAAAPVAGAAVAGEGALAAGGAEAMAAGGAEAMAAEGGAEMMLGSGAEAAVEGAEFIEGGSAFGSDPDLLNADMSHQEIYGNSTRDAFHDDYFSGDQYYDNDLQNSSDSINNAMSEGEIEDFLDSNGLEGEEREAVKKLLKEQGHGKNEKESSNNSTSRDKAEAEAKAEAKIAAKRLEEGKSGENGDKIHASSVTVVGGNIEIKDAKLQNGEGNNTDSGKITTKDNEEEENSESKKGNNAGLKEEDFEIEEGQRENKKKRFLARNIGRMKNLNEVVEGKKGIVDLWSEADPNSQFGKMYDKVKDKKSIKDFKKFEDIGGTTELYKGMNRIRDTFFVEPRKYNDTQQTIADREKNLKDKNEKIEYKMVHNEGNREYIIKQDKLMEKYSAENYPKKTEAERYEMAKKEAEAKLASIAKEYVPLGITDVKTAYQLSQDQKEYGYTPKEALINQGKFNNFDSKPTNINIINEKFGENVSSVSQAIPSAREYYNNGYRDVQGMLNVDFIQRKLQTSLDMAMKIERALSSKGKVNYNGQDEEVKKKFDEINKYYESNQKKKR